MVGLKAESRPLTGEELALVEDARQKASVLYWGEVVAHRSCGIAVAETFDRQTAPYQSLRRGGITGEGQCGSIRAGEAVLGELLGDPSPSGAVTDELRRAINWFQRQIPFRIDPGESPDNVCNNLTRQHGEFSGEARRRFCTDLTAEVAALTTEALLRFGGERLPSLKISPLDGGDEAGHPS